MGPKTAARKLKATTWSANEAHLAVDSKAKSDDLIALAA